MSTNLPSSMKSDAQPGGVAAFDFLCRFRGVQLNPRQAAECLGRGLDFVYEQIEEGLLEAHAPLHRQKRRYTITRRSVLLLLSRMALYDPTRFPVWVDEFVGVLSPEQCSRIAARAGAEGTPGEPGKVSAPRLSLLRHG